MVCVSKSFTVRSFPKHMEQEAQLTHINQLQTIPHDAKPLKLCGMLLKTYYTYNSLRDYSVLSVYKFLQNAENVL